MLSTPSAVMPARQIAISPNDRLQRQVQKGTVACTVAVVATLKAAMSGVTTTLVLLAPDLKVLMP